MVKLSLLIIFGLSGLGQIVLAHDTGPLLYQFNTTEVYGEFSPYSGADDVNIPVEPGDGIKCEFEIHSIEQHLQGANLSGWHIDFNFFHPQIPSGRIEFVDDFFWNSKIAVSPFTSGFKTFISFLLPFEDKVKTWNATYNSEKQVLNLTTNGFANFYDLTLLIQYSVDQVKSVTYIKTMMGDEDPRIECGVH